MDDEIQDIRTQNMIHWYTEYFKLKETVVEKTREEIRSP